MNRIVKAGSFCSSSLSLVVGIGVFQAAANLWASDVSLYTVKKGLAYAQTSSSVPSPDSANGFVFQTDVYPSVQGFVTNAYVKVSGSNFFTQLEPTSSGTHYQFKNSKNTAKALKHSFPDGSYLFAVYGVHDGTVSVSLPLQGDIYPLTPYVTNFTPLQSVNANGYCVIGWQGYSSGAASDYIRLTVSDSAGNNVWQSPNQDKQTAWGGLASYAAIGPGTFATGQVYTATLEFSKNAEVNLTSYPGALGVAAYFTETKFSVAASTAAAPDVKQVEVEKGIFWIQTNSGPPVPDPAGQYGFQAAAKAYQIGSLTNGTLVLPATPSGPATQSLALESDLVTIQFQDTASSATTLESLYGDGNYTLKFNTPDDGPKSLSLALQSVTNAPPPPHVANFNSLQAVNASQSFTVSWDKWSGGPSSGFVQLRIEDLQGNKVFQTSNIGSQIALNPGATNYTIAAGTLLPGQSYVGTLSFARLASLDTTSYPAVLFFGDYDSVTTFNITTMPADLAGYSICKGLVYTQAGAGSPVPLAANAGWFSAQVTASSSTSVLRASVSAPLGPANSLIAQPGGLVWSFASPQPTQSALDTAYPFGAYNLQVSCANEGLESLSLALSTPSYPSAPHITSYSSAQAIDSTADFTLGWDPYTGPLPNTFVQLIITNLNGTTVFETPALGMPGALSDSDTSVVIPAGSLSPNEAYQAALLFEGIQTIDTVSSPGATGLAAVSATTLFGLGTTGPGNLGVLTLTSTNASHLFQVAATVAPGQSYRLDGSPVLPPVWTPLATNTPAGSAFIFLDPNSAGRRQFFYRLVLLP
jgi:hypothetical protein